MRTPHLIAAALAEALTIAAPAAQAGEIGHYAPAVMNIRDYAMPEPCFYGVVYEFASEDRFQGPSIGLNFAIEF